MSPDVASDAPARRVVVARRLRADREQAIGIASAFQTSVTLVPSYDQAIITPVAPLDVAVDWHSKVRPVVDITLLVDGHLVIGLHLGAVDAVRATGWVAQPGEPEFVIRTDAPSSDPVSDAETVALGLRLDDGRRRDLERLLADPQAASAQAMFEALGLPPATQRILDGVDEPSRLPGAVVAEALPPRTAFVEMLLQRPTGSSLLDRLRQLDHDRPIASIALISLVVVLAVASGVLAVATARSLGVHPWPIVLTLLSLLLSIDAIVNVVVLRAIRRRIRTEASVLA